jgi:hypothetical protein
MILSLTLSLVRCTWYNQHGEVYLIQPTWWGVLDTTNSHWLLYLQNEYQMLLHAINRNDLSEVTRFKCIEVIFMERGKVNLNINAINWLRLHWNQNKISRSIKSPPFLGVKPVIHQSELRTYTKVVPFQEKSSFHFINYSIVKTTEWNGLIKIDNWS